MGSVEELREYPVDYHSVPKEKYVIVDPVPFTKQQYEFLVHDKQVLENKAIRIHKKFQDLIIALSSAYMEGKTFVKDKSANKSQMYYHKY